MITRRMRYGKVLQPHLRYGNGVARRTLICWLVHVGKRPTRG
ncbi:MAG: hypothetical protein Q8L48_16725 [Archangium sp.]|nr:hypothetical protein [Archangium sp.]